MTAQIQGGHRPGNMRCPECQKVTRATVINNWRSKDGAYLLRRRVCGCPLKRVFTTYEFPGDHGKLLATHDAFLRKYIKKQFGIDIDQPLDFASEAPELVDLEGHVMDQHKHKMER